jgi:hypothetical protein
VISKKKREKKERESQRRNITGIEKKESDCWKERYREKG